MLARILYIIAVAAPMALPAIASKWQIEALFSVNALLPPSGWIGFALVIALGGLLWSIAKRAKALEDETQGDVLVITEEMTVHQFLEYAGLEIGDVSNEGVRSAEQALGKLEMLARAGSVKIWGTPSRQGFLGLPELVPADHWKAAFIYPIDAIEDRPSLGIRTHPRDARLSSGPVANRPELYDHLYISASAVKRQFKRNELKTPHAPSHRQKAPVARNGI